MASQWISETIQRQAVEAMSSSLPELETVVKSETGNNKLSARMPEYQYQLEIRQTGTHF